MNVAPTGRGQERSPLSAASAPANIPWLGDSRSRGWLGPVAIFRYVVVDVFTDTPLQGNQLAVFTDARDIPEERLQPLAKEMAFSETVFVYPPMRREPAPETASTHAEHRADNAESVFVLPPEADGHARIRIFTPASEIPFAG